MADNWVGYDSIAQTYEQIHSQRLTGPARILAERLAQEEPPKSVLDLGVGTGVATKALHQMFPPEIICCGVDLSREMLQRAKTSGLTRLAVADACQLPFPSSNFDLVVASFVLSHMMDPQVVLRETLRVLRPRGRLAATAWLESRLQEAIQVDWRKIATRYVPEDILDRAQSIAVPSEVRFGNPENLLREFERSGFVGVTVVECADTYNVSLVDHITERAAYSAGRYMRAALPRDRWQEFLADVSSYLHSRHPRMLKLDNSFLLAIGLKP